ncbi:hypothetical protein JOB18_001478, partial [Solea senegalensis]
STTSTPVMCSSPVSVLYSSPSSSVNHSPASSAIGSPPSSSAAFVPNWVENLKIPWHNLPEELVQILERQKRPSPRLRREMVRTVVSEMMKTCKNPTKRNTTEIAKRMVAKYPKSLEDVIDGDVIGLGYHSLVKQLQSRIENVKRPDTPMITKRKAQLDDDDTDEIPTEQKASVQDTYGCVNWEPKHLPLSETAESQLDKKERMKMLFENNNYQTEDVIEHIKSTFYTQCKEINKGTSIETLCREWPFLFIQAGMAEHFQQLTGVSLTGSFHENVDKKGERLLNFLKTGDSRKHKPVLNALLKLQAERNQSSGCSEEVIEMVLLLMAHFGENEAHLFHCVEETSLAKEVQMKDVPLTPCLIVL